MEKSNFVQELSSKELENVNGGIHPVVVFILYSLLDEGLHNPQDYVNGFRDGANSNF